MKLIDIAAITIGDRQRKEFAPKALEELKASIAANGLIHCPVLTEANELVAGERRLRAMTMLHQEGVPFTYDGGPVPVDQIPYTLLVDADESTIAEAEFAENIFRVDLTWQERTAALSRLLALRQAEAPSTTLVDVAREIHKSQPETAVRTLRRDLANAQILAKHMDNPAVKRARSADEAMRVVLDEFEGKIKAQAAKSTVLAASDHRIIHGDCIEEMKKLPSGLCDAIICDPPYGMKADKMGKGEFHMYDDSPEAALTVIKAILSEGFRITKPKAILFLFCDLDHFAVIKTYAAQQAWTPFRSPLIWRKGIDGHSPWGRAGFIRTYEAIFFAVKGAKELLYPGGPDVLDFKRPGRAERVHAAEKPVDLLRRLIKLSALPGQTVLDPTAGSGPIIEAAMWEKVKVVAIEKEKEAHNECLARLNKPLEDSKGETVEPPGISTAELLED